MKKIFIFLMCIFALTACSFPDVVECYCCGNNVESNKARDIDNEFFCNDCYNNSKECDNCHQKYLHENYDSHFNYCYSCLYDTTVAFQCAECGEYKTVDERYTSISNEYICAKCTIDFLIEEINDIP